MLDAAAIHLIVHETGLVLWLLLLLCQMQHKASRLYQVEEVTGHC